METAIHGGGPWAPESLVLIGDCIKEKNVNLQVSENITTEAPM
jgi:hypothetical protein